ncbi:MAG: hypothetical protein GXO50_06890 [Chlorobi bacterium]|nr:hypothetical protein [Chlorobiota bacterium]
MKYIFKKTGFIIIIFTLIIACNKDDKLQTGTVNLLFSRDTVFFDTVFSGIGSDTRYFKVKNPYDLPVNINKIYLEKGDESKFKININGIPENYTENTIIDAGDSIYVFVEVLINTDEDNITEEDKIIFDTGENSQNVKLLAIGTDVHFLNDSLINSQTWINDKPYLIYNSVAVAENQTLTIEEGTHIYSHKDSRFIIAGTLKVNGTEENPVIFEADRLNGHSSIFYDIFAEDSTDNYYDVAGQWSGIWLTKLSKDNEINNAIIKNAITGITVDSSQNSNPQLSIHNSIIEHHSSTGIFARISSISATNCLIADCGYYNILLTRGGNYEFYHCTVSNYWKGIRNTPAVYINNYFQYDGTVYLYDLEKAYFGNCIIWGNTETETAADVYTEGVSSDYMFDNCILKIDPESNINTNDPEHYSNILLNTDPLFTDFYEYDFTLSENSPAINKGNISITNTYPALLNFDLNNINRTNDAAPDLGCYEFQ